MRQRWPSILELKGALKGSMGREAIDHGAEEVISAICLKTAHV